MSNNVTSVQVTPESANSYKAAAAASLADHVATGNSGLASLEVNPGTYSTTLTNGEVVESGKHANSTSFNTYETTKGDGVNLLSTAKTSYGSPTTTLTKDTFVHYEGMDIKLEQAERMGLVKQVNGQYVEVATQDRSTAEQAQEQEAGETLGVSLEAELSTLAGIIAPSMQTSLVESVLRQGLSATSLNGMVEGTGMSQEQLRARLGTVEQAFRAQADKALMSAGMGKEDIPSFVQWAQDKHKGAFDDACRNHAYNRSTSGYAPLARAWMNSTMPNADSLPEALNSRTVGGETLVTLPGYPEMSLKVATRLGLI